MCKVLLFGGTEEGREIAELLAAKGVPSLVCVATEYGAAALPKGVKILQKRLESAEMAELMKGAELCVDATHPYADRASENISAACGETGTRYVRVIRESLGYEGCESFENAENAAEYLKNTEGNVFITTGVKELEKFIPIGTERVFARVLPSVESVEKCENLGITGRHLICMQGPFSEELNRAMMRAVDAAFLVTKESGANGGFKEKLAAAESLGVKTLVITRPRAENGFTLERVLEMIEEII